MRAVLYNPWKLFEKFKPLDLEHKQNPEYHADVAKMFEDEAKRRGIDTSNRDPMSSILCGMYGQAEESLYYSCFSEIELPDSRNYGAWTAEVKKHLFGELADQRIVQQVHNLIGFEEKKGYSGIALVDEEGYTRLEAFLLTKWRGYPEMIAGPVVFCSLSHRTSRPASTSALVTSHVQAIQGIMLTVPTVLTQTVPKSKMH